MGADLLVLYLGEKIPTGLIDLEGGAHMSCRLSELVLNCQDPEALSRFWCCAQWLSAFSGRHMTLRTRCKRPG